MKSPIALGLIALSLSAVAAAQTCTGPGPCAAPIDLSAPTELCLSAALGCAPVAYQRIDGLVPGMPPAWFVVAYSSVQGYPVASVAGPCLPGWECPALAAEAFERLRVNALIGQRAIRWARP
ncbi:MAG: hypothetical protein WAT67_13545 [Candidatus Contendobacter sp.]